MGAVALLGPGGESLRNFHFLMTNSTDRSACSFEALPRLGWLATGVSGDGDVSGILPPVRQGCRIKPHNWGEIGRSCGRRWAAGSEFHWPLVPSPSMPSLREQARLDAERVSNGAMLDCRLWVANAGSRPVGGARGLVSDVFPGQPGAPVRRSGHF